MLLLHYFRIIQFSKEIGLKNHSLCFISSFLLVYLFFIYMKHCEYFFFSGITCEIYVVSLMVEIIKKNCRNYKCPS